MANNGAPDSWEQQADLGTGENADNKDMSAKFSTLNVNAAEFVPSFSYSPPSDETVIKSDSPDKVESPVANGVEEPPPVPEGETSPEPLRAQTPNDDVVQSETQPQGGDDTEPSSPSSPPPPPPGGDESGGGETPPPADSWEAAALDSDPPSGASGVGEEDDEVIEAKPKKKPPRPEETRSKKEHVNVVIIGHVGEEKETQPVITTP